MLGPTLVVFLLLLLPSPLLTTRSPPDPYRTQDQGHHPSSRLQESPADVESCWSTYDVYFVLDSKKINNALVEMLYILPSGAINMEHGLEKANEQIKRTRAAGQRVPTLIIVLTGGELLPESFAKTQVEAAKSRQLGATLYFVGMEDYQLYQLLEIAGEEGHVFGVDTGYSGLEDIVGPLIVRSCVQIMSVDYSTTCARGKNEVKVIGKGFENTQKEEVVCQFRIRKKTIRMKAVSVEDTSITCPGPKLNDRGQAVFIDISLDNGLTFIKTDLDVSRRNCVTSRCAALSRQEGHTVIMSYYNEYKMTMQVNYRDVRLQMPIVDHPAVHSTNPAAIPPSSAARAHVPPDNRYFFLALTLKTCRRLHFKAQAPFQFQFQGLLGLAACSCMDLGKRSMGHLSPLWWLSVPDPKGIPSKGEEMVLRDKMVHLVIVRVKGLLFPPKRGGTGTRDMLIRSQLLGFCRFAICPQLRLSTDEPLACKDGVKIINRKISAVYFCLSHKKLRGARAMKCPIFHFILKDSCYQIKPFVSLDEFLTPFTTFDNHYLRKLDPTHVLKKTTGEQATEPVFKESSFTQSMLTLSSLKVSLLKNILETMGARRVLTLLESLNNEIRT
ncbi:Anthrax Toxin Receptor-Like [Manis pentadactyla]|nr:Anthrax Toxin Receptor-Like [Manis pentadactyla]